MKKIGLLFAVLISGTSMMFGQGAQNIKINEVMTDNTGNYLDEYGNTLTWVELVNSSFTTYNVRGMFLTTDKAVLDEEMSVPDRMKRMSQIPNGFDESLINGRHHLLLFLNSKPEKGPRHLNVKVEPGQETWLALYDGNAKNLIDSVTIPALASNTSYARIADGADKWVVCKTDKVTPNANNVTKQELSKVEKIKTSDPHGFLLSILSMAVVFACLALLYVFMKIFGKVSTGFGKKECLEEVPVQEVAPVAAKKAADKDVYMAVIAMALDEYNQDVHDIESGVITIRKNNNTIKINNIQLWQNNNNLRK